MYQDAAIIIAIIFILFFSVIVHEVSHGLAALRNGDDTARRHGRLTLNPLPHVDPVGTILLPVFLVVMNAILPGRPFLFGWARPVPVNPALFRDFRKGLFEVGLSGPLSNIALGLFFALLFRLAAPAAAPALVTVLSYAVFINFLLAAFNLIPIPPLDGSRIVGSFLSPSQQLSYFRFERQGIFIVILLVFFTPLFQVVIGLVRWAARLAIGAGPAL